MAQKMGSRSITQYSRIFTNKEELEALNPEPSGFLPIDLSRIPVWHLLNLFADIVHQHNDGWFSTELVDGLHENIRQELEARVEGRRLPPPPPRVPMLQRRIDAQARSALNVKLDKPFRPNKAGVMRLCFRPTRGGVLVNHPLPQYLCDVCQ